MSADADRPDDDHSTLARIIGERKGKAASLREVGRHPYRNDFTPSHDLASLRQRYQPTKPAPVTPDPTAPKAASGPRGGGDGGIQEVSRNFPRFSVTDEKHLSSRRLGAFLRG